MEKKFNYVYVTTNLLNRKQYIGSHCTNNIDDSYIGSGRLFLKAVRKYGKCNFIREILEECETAIIAREKERHYIELYNTLDPNGYNLSPMGGIGFKGATHSQVQLDKMSIWQKGKTYEELYGSEKAAKMKEKQRQKKLGTTTNRKGKGIKQEMIEKYGEIEGLKRYNIFISKQKENQTGKKQSKETIKKRMDSMGDPWNKGKNYTLGKYSQERIEKSSKKAKESFYLRLDKDKIELIRELFNKQIPISEIVKATGYHFNKIKRIITEIL